jgi:hypothetical protein
VGSIPTLLTMISKKDKKFVLDIPDEGFSPQRNRQVIENSIKKYEAKRAERMKAFREGISERAEAVTSFWHHVNQGKHNDIDRYFGPQMLAKLRGADIIDELRNRANVITKPTPFYIEKGIVKSMGGKIVGKEVSNVKKAQKRTK